MGSLSPLTGQHFINCQINKKLFEFSLFECKKMSHIVIGFFKMQIGIKNRKLGKLYSCEKCSLAVDTTCL